ncbi:hypothetical protein C8R48DRAFT_764518 [Suillus tomentosus]|nr:hypothetical protein C8R48DRAFT_764518 [Suillus tomentosus]
MRHFDQGLRSGRPLGPTIVTAHLPSLPLENMEALAVNRLTWFTGYDIEKHASTLHVSIDLQTNPGVQECITFQGLNCEYRAIYDTIRCSPASPQPENGLEGMNILLKGALGTGERAVAHAICNMLKRLMLDVRANDIPYLAAKLVLWNPLVVVDHGDLVCSSRTYRHYDSRIRVAWMYDETWSK